MVIANTPAYPRPVPTDVIARDLEEVIAEIIANRGYSYIPTELEFVAGGGIFDLTGSPGKSSIGGFGIAPAWGLNDGSSMGVGILTRIPASWATYDIVVEGANRVTANTGDIVLNHYRSAGTIGDAGFDTVVSGTQTTLTVGARSVLQQKTLATGVANPGVGKSIGIRVSRLGADAADTLAGAWDLSRIILRKAS